MVASKGPAKIAGPISLSGVFGMDGFIGSIIDLLEIIGALAFIFLCYGVGACFAGEKHIAGILFVGSCKTNLP